MLDKFDRVYVINLDKRRDRLDEFRKQLHSVGHDFGERIRRMPAAHPSESGGFRSVGARGCFLSHLQCMAEAADAGLDSVLIFEDDLDFVPAFTRLQEPVAAGLQAGAWDMFYGGWALHSGQAADALLPHAPGLRSVPEDIGMVTAHFVAFRGARLRDLRGYLEAMLRRPAGHPDGGPMDVDGAYNWFRRKYGCRTLVADPQLGYQRATSSDISPMWFDEVPPLKLAANLLRRIRRRRPVT